MTYKTYVSDATRSLHLQESVLLEGGERLEGVRVAFRSWGKLNRSGDNAVLVCHALTGSADADDWWGELIGPSRALDPESDFVVAPNALGGCYGTTGPSASSPGGREALGPDFPGITIRDQVRVQAEALKTLGVGRLRLVVGGSMGGMQALEWAAMTPLPVEAVAAIGAPASHSPWAVGWADAQRRAIRNDPDWREGRYDPASPPDRGLSIARMIAMCTYRSPGSFQLRFQRDKHPAGHFQVESYLRYQGQKLGARFDANSYIALTQAMDSHDLSRGRGRLSDVLAGLEPEVLVVGIRSDVLYPPEEVEEFAAGIPQAELKWIESPHGHDAFLMEQEQLNRILWDFREPKVEETGKKPDARLGEEPGARRNEYPGARGVDEAMDRGRRAELCA